MACARVGNRGVHAARGVQLERDATEPDDSCEFPGDACDDGDDTTVNDVINVDCDCVGEVDRVDEFTRWGIALFPTTCRM